MARERPRWLEEVEQDALSYFSRPSAHGWDHVQRVRALALHIAQAEGADPVIVEAAALLHDIGREAAEARGTPHAVESEHLARAILAARKCPPTIAEAVAEAIRAHPWTGREPARTLEAQVLQDADRLDALGAVGVARTFVRAGELGRGIAHGAEHFAEKLCNLAEQMNTATARRIAAERDAFMRAFFDQLKRELADGGASAGGEEEARQG